MMTLQCVCVKVHRCEMMVPLLVWDDPRHNGPNIDSRNHLTICCVHQEEIRTRFRINFILFVQSRAKIGAKMCEIFLKFQPVNDKP